MEAIPGLRALGLRMEEKLRQKYGSRDYNALDENMRATFVRVVNEDLAPLYPRMRASTLLIWGTRTRRPRCGWDRRWSS